MKDQQRLVPGTTIHARATHIITNKQDNQSIHGLNAGGMWLVGKTLKAELKISKNSCKLTYIVGHFWFGNKPTFKDVRLTLALVYLGKSDEHIE